MSTQQPLPDCVGTSDSYMTEQELIDFAATHDYSVSPAQLDHWYKEDCLPHPEQRHPLGQSGSASYYPPPSSRQLLALCRLHKRETRYTHLRFLLWLEGFDIPIGAVRESLHIVMNEANRTLGKA